MTRARTAVNLGTKVLLSVEEMAILSGEIRATLYRVATAGTLPLPVYVVGRRLRIPRRTVARLTEGLGDFGEESTDGTDPVDWECRL